MKEILCEENGYKLIIEDVDKFEENDIEVIELEIVEDNREKELEVNQEGFTEILKRFIKSYCKEKKQGNINLENWLQNQLKKEFPNKTEEELKNISKELVVGVEEAEKKYREVWKYSSFGVRVSDYLGEQIEESVLVENLENPKEYLKNNIEELKKSNVTETYKLAGKTGAEIISGVKAFDKMNRYFTNINETIANGNEKMIETLTTKSGAINQNPNLDGFIFEQFHENTFNIDAAIKNVKGVRAEALVPEVGSSYGRNSVDLVIKIEKDGVSRIVKKYQAKLSGTGESAENLYQGGNYKFQRKLYGKGQEEHGNTKVEYSGVESKAVSKSEMKDMQNKVQSGDTEAVKNRFENDVDVKLLSKQIGKQAIYAGTMAIGLGMAISTAGKLISGEEIEVEEVIVDGLKAGATVGISTVVAGGLKTAVEKNIITGIGAKILSNNVISTLAFSSISLVSTAYAVGSGEMDLKDGVKESGKILASTYGGLKGASIGMGLATGIVTAGSVLAPVVIVVAGTIGYFAGSEIASAIAEGVTQIGSAICSTVGSVVKAGVSAVKAVASGIYEGVKSVANSAWSGVGSVVSFCTGGLFGW